MTIIRGGAFPFSTPDSGRGGGFFNRINWQNFPRTVKRYAPVYVTAAHAVMTRTGRFQALALHKRNSQLRPMTQFRSRWRRDWMDAVHFPYRRRTSPNRERRLALLNVDGLPRIDRSFVYL